jgi:hypothetical protein
VDSNTHLKGLARSDGGVIRIITSQPLPTVEQFVLGGRKLMKRVPSSVWVPLAIFAATRVFDFVVILIASKDLPGGYLGAITNWDGEWYGRIAVEGYQLPSGAQANFDDYWAWAFLPTFPMAARGIMWLTGMGFGVSASVVNLAAGAAAMVVMYKLLERQGGRFLATSGVALTSTFITAPLFQAAYSEALGLLLVCLALLLIGSRRYALALIATVLLSLTRLITPALGVVVAVHLVHRLRHRREDPLSAAEIGWFLAMGLASIGGLWLWSSFVELRVGPGTGASARTQALADHPVLGWFSGLQDLLGWPGTGLVLIISIALILCSLAPSVTGSWGLEVRTWLCCYPIFIFASTPVTTGVLRYLLLAFPLPLLIVSGRPTRGFPWGRTSTLLATCLIGLFLQVFWISHSLTVDARPGVFYMMP